MNKEKADYEYTLIDGRRVKVAARRYKLNGDSDGLEPSYGYHRKVVTPWGEVEKCFIVSVPSLSGGKERFASIYKPVTNPGVRWSVFQIDEDFVAIRKKIA